MLALSLMAAPAMAQDASACIEPGQDAKKAAHTLTNGCPIDVVVFWCHHGAGRREAACDPSRKFYRQNTVLKPGEFKANPYAMPLGDDISFGGCFGKWGGDRAPARPLAGDDPEPGPVDPTGAWRCRTWRSSSGR